MIIPITTEERKEKKEDNAQEELLAMLSFAHCQSVQAVEEHAAKIARELLSRWYFFSFGDVRKILEVEFYLYIPGVLEDDAVHRRWEQQTTGRFYTHTNCLNDKWSAPIFNRHGIDITCGNAELGIYGGILIRHLDGKLHRPGPGLVLRALLRGDQGLMKIAAQDPEHGWKDYEVDYLRQLSNSSIFKGKTRLVYIGSSSVTVKKGPRKGIEKTNFAFLPLRFYL